MTTSDLDPDALLVERAERLIPQLEKATASFGWTGTSEAAALIRELLADRRWQPIETASIGVRYLVRGWGEGNKHHVFEFATKDKSIACVKWNMGRGDKLWFEPVEYMDLGSLGVSSASAKTAEDRGVTPDRWHRMARGFGGGGILAVVTTGLVAHALDIPFHGTPYEWMVAAWGSLFGIAIQK